MDETRQTLTEELLREMCEVQGKPALQVAKELGYGRTTVYKACHRFGIQLRPKGFQKGDQHCQWKGGRHHDKSGYVLVHRPDHPNANHSGYVREHRLVMEQHLGRYLTADEVVHHKNDIRDDNRIENLELFAENREHLAETLNGKRPQWSANGRKKILETARRKRSLDLTKEELQSLYASHNADEIAAMHSCSPSAVYNALKRLGIPRRRGGQKVQPKWPPNEVLAADLKAMSTADVAAKYSGTVSQLTGMLWSRGTGVRELRQQGSDS